MSASKVPAKARYDLNDIAALVIEAHACVHRMDEKLDEHQRDVAAKFGALNTEMAKEFGGVRERVAHLEGKSEAIGQRVGVVPDAAQQKPAWFPKPWQVISGVCGGIGGFALLYKGVVAILPALHAWLMAAS